MRTPVLLCSAALLLSTGCATSLASMDTARTTAPKHVRASLASGLFVPVGAVADVVSEGEEIARAAKGGKTPTAKDAARLADAGIAYSLTPVSFVQEVMLRTGILEDWDVGLRYATTSLRLDTKYRFFHSGTEEEGSKHAAVGIGASKYLFDGPVFQALEVVKIDDFSRWDFDAQLLYSWELKDVFAFYAGGKYVLTRFSFSETLSDLTSVGGAPLLVSDIDSNMHFFGGLVGINAGYKYAFIALELDGGYTTAKPRYLSLETGKVEEHKLGGVTLYPSIGLVLKF